MDQYEALKYYFGHSQFRQGQEALIDAILSGRDVLGIMPTGGGKSLCYQIPALVFDGITLVISPLISLMADQVAALNQAGVPGAYLNSALDLEAYQEVLQGIRRGTYKLLYVAPERLTAPAFLAALVRTTVSLVAVDEAHCVSQWGQDFRPSYLKIPEFLEQLPARPVMGAFTATATAQVKADIIQMLGLRAPEIVTTGFDRPNLYFETRRALPSQKPKELLDLVLREGDNAGIVYCSTTKQVDETARLLQSRGIRAAAYHAKLDAEVRRKNQDDFLYDRVQIMVATNAFGMGIDKSNVSFVIHYNMPKNMESYYQEAGRAGRDGKEGICVAFYSYKDLKKLEKFMENKPIAEQDIGRQLLQETAAYAESSVCRRKMLLHYFGEEYPKDNCGMCDNCVHPKQRIDAEKQLAIVLRAVGVLKENFKQEYLIDFVKGRATDDIRIHHHDELEEFGEGENEDPKIWNPVICQGLLNGYMRKDIESYGILKLTAAGKRYLKSPKPFQVVMDAEFKDEDYEEGGEGGFGVLDPQLFAMLKDLRHDMARKLERPPYVIFQDVSLEQMATIYPINEKELLNIQGVGAGKAKRYGQPFCDLIKKYCEENDIVRPEEYRVKTVAKKSMQKVKIIQSIDHQLSLDDIARAEGLDFDELIDKLDDIVDSGTKLNIDYYLDDTYDEDQIDDIYDYFMESDTDDIDKAMDELNEDYTEEEIRLVRIQFISEMAN